MEDMSKTVVEEVVEKDPTIGSVFAECFKIGVASWGYFIGLCTPIAGAVLGYKGVTYLKQRNAAKKAVKESRTLLQAYSLKETLTEEEQSDMEKISEDIDLICKYWNIK